MKLSKIKKIIFSSLFALGTISSTSLILASCVKKDTNNYQENNNYEEYIHNNSLSLLSSFKTKSLAEITEYFSSYETIDSTNIQLINTYFNFISEKYGPVFFSNPMQSLGTAWLFDYSIADENLNLFNYYLATNTHVLEINNKFEFRDDVNIYTLQVPVNASFNSELKVFLGQPVDDVQLYASEVNNSSKNDWLLTDININNFTDRFIPVGEFDPDGTSKTLDESIHYQFSFNTTNISTGQSVTNYYYKNSAGLATKTENLNIIPTNKGDDFSILKIRLNPNDITFGNDINSTDSQDDVNNSSSDNQAIYTKNQYKLTDAQRQKSLENIRNIFKVDYDPEQTITNNNSYISRLNKLITLAENKMTSNPLFKELFLFEDKTTWNSKRNSDLMVGGFPGVQKDNLFSSKWSFSSIKVENIIDLQEYSQVFGPLVYRPTIESNYNGTLTVSTYNNENNFLLPKVNLQPGSSGSMALIDDKIFGIYWGVLNNGEYGIVTPLYVADFSQNSIIKKWLNYIKSKDSNSNLYKLFKGMNKIN